MNSLLFYIADSILNKPTIVDTIQTKPDSPKSAISQVSDFLFNVEFSLWQELFWGSLLIPIMIKVYQTLFTWINETHPLNKLLQGFRSANRDVIIYLSQLSPSIKGIKNQNAEFVSLYPVPTPTDVNALGKRVYINIDPLWSESDGKCANYVINLLGKSRSKNSYKIANLTIDWNNTLSPIISIGFNPKTQKLLTTCSPINFDISGTYSEILCLKSHDIELHARGKDWGVIQRTSDKNTKQPVLVLAGGGTAGTEVSGFVLNKYSIELGKLYGNNHFCLSFETDRKISNTHYNIMSLYPYPNLYNRIRYLYTFYKWKRKKVFPKQL